MGCAATLSHRVEQRPPHALALARRLVGEVLLVALQRPIDGDFDLCRSHQQDVHRGEEGAEEAAVLMAHDDAPQLSHNAQLRAVLARDVHDVRE